MTLKEFIKKWGISQREIANKSGLSFGSFHNKLFENSTMPGYVTKFTESDKKTIAATFKEMKNDLKNLDL